MREVNILEEVEIDSDDEEFAQKADRKKKKALQKNFEQDADIAKQKLKAKRLKAKQARRGKRDEDDGESDAGVELASYSGDGSQ